MALTSLSTFFLLSVERETFLLRREKTLFERHTVCFKVCCNPNFVILAATRNFLFASSGKLKNWNSKTFLPSAWEPPCHVPG